MTEDATTDGQSRPATTNSRRARASVNGLLAVVFVVLVAIAAAGLWLRHEEVLADASGNAEKLTGILSEHLAIRFDTIDETLYQLAQHSRMIGGPEASGMEWMPTLSMAVAGRYAIESVIVTNADGTATFSSLPMNMGDSWEGGHLFNQLSADPTDDALVTDAPTRSLDNGRMVVPVGRVLRTVNSEFEGMLIATLAPERLREFYASVDVGENGVISILHPQNQIVFRHPADNKLIGEALPIIPVPSEATEGGAQGVVSGPLESGGPTYLTAYRTSEKTGLTVTVSLVQGALLAAWWYDVYVALGFALLVGLILIGVSIMVSRALKSRDAVVEAN